MSNSMPALSAARLLALLVGLLAGCQASLGMTLPSNPAAVGIHKMIAMVTIVVAGAAAVATWLARRSVPPLAAPVGIGLAVAAVVQFALGEMHLVMIHMSVGVLFVIGAVALIFTTMKRTPPAPKD